MMKKILKLSADIASGLFAFIGILAFFIALRTKYLWNDVYFEQILTNGGAGIYGLSKDVLSGYIKFALFPALLFSLIVLVVNKIRWSIFLGLFGLCFAAYAFNFPQYVYNQFSDTLVYKEEYINPKSISFNFPVKKRNLILLYLESIESGYADTSQNGENLLPNLSKMAEQNISFEGFHQLPAQDYTIAALVSSFCAIPYKYAPAKNYTSLRNFLPQVVCFPQILQDAGYKTYFMKGAPLEFSRTDSFLESHGIDEAAGTREIQWNYDYDLNQYQGSSWGFRDRALYNLAKQRLLQIAAQNTPFMFSLLTLDTHKNDFYMDNECVQKYGDKRDVILCADSMAAEFITWIKEQDFYADTTVVVMGDHPQTGKNELFPDLQNRQIVNLIFNPAIETTKEANFIRDMGETNSTVQKLDKLNSQPQQPLQSENRKINLTNRQWTTLDAAPTILSALGVKFPKGKFGLGRSLFSSEPTLYEKMGQRLDYELMKSAPEYKKFDGITKVFTPLYTPYLQWNKSIKNLEEITKYASFSDTISGAVWLDTLSFTLPENISKDLEFELQFRLLFVVKGKRTIKVYANHQLIADWAFYEKNPQPFKQSFKIPHHVIGADRKLLLQFKGEGLGYLPTSVGIGVEEFKLSED